MLKIGLNLTPFAHYTNTYKPHSFNLMHIVLESELNNIDAIQFYLGSDFSHLTLNDIEQICLHSKKFINLCIPLHSPNLSDILKLNPNMITFCDSLNSETFEVNSVKMTDLPSDIVETCERLKNKGILSSICIDPDVRDIKATAKLDIDYIHFNLSSIHLSENRNDEIEEFQKLEMALIAAEKFGFGISIYGDLTTFNVYEYNSHNQIEEIYTGMHLFERSLQIGLSAAIHEYSQLLKNI